MVRETCPKQGQENQGKQDDSHQAQFCPTAQHRTLKTNHGVIYIVKPRRREQYNSIPLREECVQQSGHSIEPWL